jgi:hypothetical protein
MSQPDTDKLNNKDLNGVHVIDKIIEKKTISHVDSLSQLNSNNTKPMNMSMRSTSNGKCSSTDMFLIYIRKCADIHVI